MDIYNKVRDIIIDVVTKRYNQLDIKTLNLITCEQPKNFKFGDLSTNLLMILKNITSEDINEIKNLILVDLEAISIFDKVTYVKPGFINFILNKDIWYEVICSVNKKNNYGFKNIGSNRKVNLEFISANPTGPLHVGHLRGAVFGDVLSRLMTKTGFKVTKEYYVNDLGNQIENLFQTVKIHIENTVSNTNKALKEGMYPGDYLKDIALQLIKENIDLSNKMQVKESIVEKILDLIKKDLSKLGIVFDSFISEKVIHEQGILNQVLNILDKKNLIYEGTLEAPKGKKDINWKPENQLIFKSSNFGDNVDRAIRKNNGENCDIFCEYKDGKIKQKLSGSGCKKPFFCFGASAHLKSYINTIKELYPNTYDIVNYILLFVLYIVGPAALFYAINVFGNNFFKNEFI